MNTENSIILSPEEIKEKMLITIVKKGGNQENFFVSKIDPENKEMFHGYYEKDIRNHPEKLAYDSIQPMVHISFINSHLELRHTTDDKRKEFKSLLLKKMETVIKVSAGSFVKRDKMALDYIKSL